MSCHSSCPQFLNESVVLDEAWRSDSNQVPVGSPSFANGTRCDAREPQPLAQESTIRTEARWYRFEGAAGYRMPNQAPARRACGAEYSGWLTGSQVLLATEKPPLGRVLSHTIGVRQVSRPRKVGANSMPHGSRILSCGMSRTSSHANSSL